MPGQISYTATAAFDVSWAKAGSTHRRRLVGQESLFTMIVMIVEVSLARAGFLWQQLSKVASDNRSSK
jgi:hypothetical protein